jgi:hypothetical protein
MVWRGECRFMCCQLGPGSNRYSPSECPLPGTKDLGGREKPARGRRLGAAVRPDFQSAETWWERSSFRNSCETQHKSEGSIS